MANSLPKAQIPVATSSKVDQTITFFCQPRHCRRAGFARQGTCARHARHVVGWDGRERQGEGQHGQQHLAAARLAAPRPTPRLS